MSSAKPIAQSSYSQLPAWIMSALLLSVAYGLLGLTFTTQLSHTSIMRRCVLVEPNMARIWSVGNVEIGLAYLGVFLAMTWYFARIFGKNRAHLTDLGLASLYLVCSFTLDFFCVQHLEPFPALLIGDAIVMTFTVIVSRQLWFQRLLGVFVPIIFFSCGVGHLLEGLSYWHQTYPFNVPWTMVTADIGFAVLVNSARFPAFIRGQDVVEELVEAQARTAEIEALNRQLQRAMTETHHRVKNNLQSIAALVDIQLNPDAETVSTEQLKRIGTHVRTLAVVHDLLTQQARKVGDAQSLSSQALLERLIVALRQLNPQRRILAQIEDVPLSSQQGTALSLAVNELVCNAVKYGEGDIDILLQRLEGSVALDVCNAGAGFSPGFSPAASEQIGLELVENLATWDLQGTIRFDNLPEGGARVRILFPLIVQPHLDTLEPVPA
jgi:two-component sensor histidine kinase